MVLRGAGFRAFWVGFEVFGWAGTLAFYLVRRPIYRYILIGFSQALTLLPVTQRGIFRDLVYQDLAVWLVSCSSLLLAALMGGRLASFWSSHRRANEIDFEGPHAEAGLAARLSQ
jgi:hypothetical protein